MSPYCKTFTPQFWQSFNTLPEAFVGVGVNTDGEAHLGPASNMVVGVEVLNDPQWEAKAKCLLDQVPEGAPLTSHLVNSKQFIDELRKQDSAFSAERFKDLGKEHTEPLNAYLGLVDHVTTEPPIVTPMQGLLIGLVVLVGIPVALKVVSAYAKTYRHGQAAEARLKDTTDKLTNTTAERKRVSDELEATKQKLGDELKMLQDVPVGLEARLDKNLAGVVETIVLGSEIKPDNYQLRPDVPDIAHRHLKLSAALDGSYWVQALSEQAATIIYREGKSYRVPAGINIKLEDGDLIRAEQTHLLMMDFNGPRVIDSGVFMREPKIDMAHLKELKAVRANYQALLPHMDLAAFSDEDKVLIDLKHQINMQLDELNTILEAAEVDSKNAGVRAYETKLVKAAHAAWLELFVRTKQRRGEKIDPETSSAIQYRPIREPLKALRDYRRERIDNFFDRGHIYELLDHANVAFQQAYRRLNPNERRLFQEAVLIAWDRLPAEDRQIFWGLEGRRYGAIPTSFLRTFVMGLGFTDRSQDIHELAEQVWTSLKRFRPTLNFLAQEPEDSSKRKVTYNVSELQVIDKVKQHLIIVEKLELSDEAFFNTYFMVRESRELQRLINSGGGSKTMPEDFLRNEVSLSLAVINKIANRIVILNYVERHPDVTRLTHPQTDSSEQLSVTPSELWLLEQVESKLPDKLMAYYRELPAEAYWEDYFKVRTEPEMVAVLGTSSSFEVPNLTDAETHVGYERLNKLVKAMERFHAVEAEPVAPPPPITPDTPEEPEYEGDTLPKGKSLAEFAATNGDGGRIPSPVPPLPPDAAPRSPVPPPPMSPRRAPPVHGYQGDTLPKPKSLAELAKEAAAPKAVPADQETMDGAGDLLVEAVEIQELLDEARQELNTLRPAMRYQVGVMQNKMREVGLVLADSIKSLQAASKLEDPTEADIAEARRLLDENKQKRAIAIAYVDQMHHIVRLKPIFEMDGLLDAAKQGSDISSMKEERDHMWQLEAESDPEAYKRLLQSAYDWAVDYVQRTPAPQAEEPPAPESTPAPAATPVPEAAPASEPTPTPQPTPASEPVPAPVASSIRAEELAQPVTKLRDIPNELPVDNDLIRRVLVDSGVVLAENSDFLNDIKEFGNLKKLAGGRNAREAFKKVFAHTKEKTVLALYAGIVAKLVMLFVEQESDESLEQGTLVFANRRISAALKRYWKEITQPG